MSTRWEYALKFCVVQLSEVMSRPPDVARVWAEKYRDGTTD